MKLNPFWIVLLILLAIVIGYDIYMLLQINGELSKLELFMHEKLDQAR